VGNKESLQSSDSELERKGFKSAPFFMSGEKGKSAQRQKSLPGGYRKKLEAKPPRKVSVFLEKRGNSFAQEEGAKKRGNELGHQPIGGVMG